MNAVTNTAAVTGDFYVADLTGSGTATAAAVGLAIFGAVNLMGYLLLRRWIPAMNRAVSSRSKVRSVPPPPPELAGAAVAVTVTDWDDEPPGPVQASVNVSVELTTTAAVPLVG